MRKDRQEQIMRILAGPVREALLAQGLEFDGLQELRLRQGQALAVRCRGEERLLNHVVTEAELRETMDRIAEYSLYAYEEELRQGFLTVEGGHRVGAAGRVILEAGRVRNFQYISAVHIRVCHEVRGCADLLFPRILEAGRVCHTLLLSPPGCGKTTLLRDLVRQISDGNRFVSGQNVGVVDERSEIAGCCRGVPQNRVGSRTDVLDNCPKAEGIMMLIRSMGPQVLAVDEIGGQRDVEALIWAMHCGVTILATAHGSSVEELREKPLLGKLLREQYFRRYVVLEARGGPGQVREVVDERGRLCT